MLRKKFSPPQPLPRETAGLTALQRRPLPAEELTLLALRYHFALRWLASGGGKLEHFVLLAQHVLIARALGNIGCRRITESTLSAADVAIETWTNRSLVTGIFRIDEIAFTALRCFLLEHDEQLRNASSAAVSVALEDLREEIARRRMASHPPFQSG